MYSKIVKEYFENPINLGIIEDADADYTVVYDNFISEFQEIILNRTN